MATISRNAWWAANSEDESPTLTVCGPRSILIVDDEATLRKGLARVLTTSGYRVFEASSALDAEKALMERPFDVILSDISMPGATGLDLLTSVRERGLSAPVLLMTGVPSVESAAQAVERGALRYLMKPFSTADLVSAIKEAVRHHDLVDLQRQAAVLLAQAKHEQSDRLELTRRFDKGIATIQMVFQPIVQRERRNVLGFEALLRCSEPALAAPPDFVGTAEKLGRLEDLGRAVRRSVARVASRASSALIFVNLHSRDLLDEELYSPTSPLSTVASRVVLEITERASLDGLGDVGDRLQRLRRLGYRIALDDLGSGYAGLSSAVQLQPEVVKLDMSLIRGIDADARRRRLLKSMVGGFRDLRTLTIAEGVETKAELDALLELGCDVFQGFLFSKPGPPFPAVTWH